MKILHLASWYPNKNDRFNGDFIQRHVAAASLYNEIIVIHVSKTEKPFFGGKIFSEISNHGNLTEHIIYYRCNVPFRFLNKIVSAYRCFILYRNTILKYKKEQKIFQFLHVHVPLNAGLAALWLKRKYNFQYALTEHYGIYNDIVDEPFQKRNWLFKYFVKKIIKESSVFIPVSKNIGEAINKMVLGKPFDVVYNSVDTKIFHSVIKENNKRFRFIHVSNMIPLKNVEGIIRTVAKLWSKRNDFELVVVGKYNSHVYALAENTNLLNTVIFFTGEIPYPEVAKQMQNADSLILFSKTENMPCVILEALCCGLPVIATNVGGIPEVINKENGLLVHSENEIELEQAMTTTIDRYNEFNRKQIEQIAHGNFSFETIGKQITDLYDQHFLHQQH